MVASRTTLSPSPSERHPRGTCGERVRPPDDPVSRSRPSCSRSRRSAQTARRPVARHRVATAPSGHELCRPHHTTASDARSGAPASAEPLAEPLVDPCAVARALKGGSAASTGRGASRGWRRVKTRPQCEARIGWSTE